MLGRLMPLDEVPAEFVKVFAVLFGLAWGSFATVAIGRIPQGLSVVVPGSRCDACGTPIAPARNVPVLAWLVLRGRASCCGAAIPVRVPVVEALGGALAYLAAERALASGGGAWALATAVVVFAASLTAVVLTFIDLDHLYLPDGGVLLLGALGVAHTGLRHGAWVEGVVGALVGFAVVYVPFIWLYERVRGFPGMGLGDAKLLAAVGLWFGTLAAVVVLVLAAIQGTIVALATLLVRGRIDEPEAVVREREELHALAADGDPVAAQILAEDPLAEPPPAGLAGARLAFGPFLCIAFLEWLFLEDVIVAHLLPGW